PAMFGDGASTPPGSVSPSLNRFGCPGNEPLGIPATTKAILARPYVRMAPGRITSMSSDPAQPALDVAGSDPDPAGSCRLEAWFPGSARPRADATGVGSLRIAQVAGGWLVSGCARSSWKVRLRTG